MITPIVGGPQIGSRFNATHRAIFRSADSYGCLSGGKTIDGTKSRDPDNTDLVGVLRAGLLMGKITSSGLYAPSIIGLTNAAYTAGGTTLTLTSQAVTELSRRIGSSGTFTIVGPPSASGIVRTATVTYSALPTTTTVTITALAHDYISGSLVMPTDGSQDMKTLIPDGYGIQVTHPITAASVSYVPFPHVPVWGEILQSQIINYPSDTSLKEWVKSELSRQGEGKFTFFDNY